MLETVAFLPASMYPSHGSQTPGAWGRSHHTAETCSTTFREPQGTEFGEAKDEDVHEYR